MVYKIDWVMLKSFTYEAVDFFLAEDVPFLFWLNIDG